MLEIQHDISNRPENIAVIWTAKANSDPRIFPDVNWQISNKNATIYEVRKLVGIKTELLIPINPECRVDGHELVKYLSG